MPGLFPFTTDLASQLLTPAPPVAAPATTAAEAIMGPPIPPLMQMERDVSAEIGKLGRGEQVDPGVFARSGAEARARLAQLRKELPSREKIGEGRFTNKDGSPKKWANIASKLAVGMSEGFKRMQAMMGRDVGPSVLPQFKKEEFARLRKRLIDSETRVDFIEALAEMGMDQAFKQSLAQQAGDAKTMDKLTTAARNNGVSLTRPDGQPKTPAELNVDITKTIAAHAQAMADDRETRTNLLIEQEARLLKAAEGRPFRDSIQLAITQRDAGLLLPGAIEFLKEEIGESNFARFKRDLKEARELEDRERVAEVTRKEKQADKPAPSDPEDRANRLRAAKKAEAIDQAKQEALIELESLASTQGQVGGAVVLSQSTAVNGIRTSLVKSGMTAAEVNEFMKQPEIRKMIAQLPTEGF